MIIACIVLFILIAFMPTIVAHFDNAVYAKRVKIAERAVQIKNERVKQLKVNKEDMDYVEYMNIVTLQYEDFVKADEELYPKKKVSPFRQMLRDYTVLTL